MALPALPVTHANVLQAWQTVYHAAAPGNVVGSRELTSSRNDWAGPRVTAVAGD